MKTIVFVVRRIAAVFAWLAFIICCPRLCSADCLPVPSGLVSWWPGEGNAFDAGDGNNGALWGNATFGLGRVGQGLVFDGNVGGVAVANSTNLQLQDFTIEAWIKRANTAIASFGSHGAGSFFGYGSFGYGFGIWNDGRLFLSKVEVDDISTSVSITNTDFHHVAVTKSGSNVVFYIDGIASTELAYAANFSFLTGVALGARPDTGDNTFLGTIDELAVYRRVLDAGEILAIYNNGSGKCRTPFGPSITLQPTSKTNFESEAVTFNVAATGDQPLAYQWRLNDADLAGKTGMLLTLSNAQLTDAGAYTAVVTNAGGSATSSPAVLVVNPRPPCAPVHEGLVSWWRAEGSQSDSWGLNTAHAGGGNIGFPRGKVGQAFSLTSAFLSVRQSQSLIITNGITIEAWVNPSSLAGPIPHTILSKFAALGSEAIVDQDAYYLGTTNGGEVMFLLSPASLPGANAALITSEALPINQWSFLVATYDGSDMSIYINGVLSTNQNYTGGIRAGTSDLAIGGIPLAMANIPPVFSQSVWPWAGLLDEVSLYNRALSPDEIQAIYTADLSGKCFAPPTIVVQPQSQSVPLGEDGLFTATFIGSRPMTFQWRFNGVNVRGATNDTLLLEKIQTIQAGSYSVAATNALGFAISSNAALTLLPRPSCVAEPNGRISWWPSDGSGLDVSGLNKATASTFPLTNVPYAIGKVGQAFNFMNRAATELSDTQVVVTNSASLNFGSNADFSIEAWIKAAPALFLDDVIFFPGSTPTSEPDFRTILDKRDRMPNGAGYALLLNRGRLACSLGVAPISPTNTTMFVSSGPDLRDGRFHHVAVSLNRGATNGCYLFVDGQVVLNFDARIRRGNLSNTANLLIGGPAREPLSFSRTSFVFHGLIDELAIYNRALSPAEVLAIHLAGASGKCKTPALVVTQPFNQRVTSGSNVTFITSAVGVTPLRYQWLRNSTAISGATNSSYTFVVLPTSGGLYSVRVTNAFGSTASIFALLTVNTVPKALDQNISLDEDTPTGITLHANDAEFDRLVYSIVMPPTHGSMSGAASNLIYIPNPNYFGADSFTFKVNDGLVDSAPATVNITVLPVNDAPVANAQSISVNEDTPINITLTAADVDNDLLTYSVVTPPKHGTLGGAPPFLGYLGFTNYNGTDSFTFKANDGQTDSMPATVNITIIPVNDAPVAVVRVSPLFAISATETNLFILSHNNTNAAAVLDGSASGDAENDPINYSWLEGTNEFAAGVTVTNSFGIGPHEIILQASDGKDVGSAHSTFEVITPAEAIVHVISLIQNSTLSYKTAQPLEASLNAAAASFNAGKPIAAINQLQAFENKARAQVATTDPDMAAELIHAAQEIIDRLSAP